MKVTYHPIWSIYYGLIARTKHYRNHIHIILDRVSYLNCLKLRVKNFIAVSSSIVYLHTTAYLWI